MPIRRDSKGNRGNILSPRDSDGIRDRLTARRKKRKENGKNSYNDEDRPVRTLMMRLASSSHSN